jgi:hypothetical protein
MTQRFFTKKDDAVKGPFEAASIQKSLDDERISPGTLIRGEDEDDYVPVAKHPYFARLAKKKAAAELAASRREFDPERDVMHEPGNFGLGFLAGMFGGIIGLILVRVLAKGEETKKGATIGFIVGIGVGLFLRLVALK